MAEPQDFSNYIAGLEAAIKALQGQKPGGQIEVGSVNMAGLNPPNLYRLKLGFQPSRIFVYSPDGGQATIEGNEVLINSATRGHLLWVAWH